MARAEGSTVAVVPIAAILAGSDEKGAWVV